MSGQDTRTHSRRLSEDRRVIFPSLHSVSSVSSRESSPREAGPKTNQTKHSDYSPTSVTNRPTPHLNDNIILHVDKIRELNIKDNRPKLVAASASQISPKGPIEIERSNSLDDLLISLPKLTVNRKNSEEPNITPKSFTGPGLRSTDPNRNIFLLTSPQNSCRKSFVFPQLKTFYPAASVPKYHERTVAKVGGEFPNIASDSKLERLPSILRSKCRRSPSPSSLSGDEEGIITTPPQTQSVLVTQNKLHLSPNVPTLASPKSIRSLSPSKRSDANDSLSKSEKLKMLSDMPKLMPKAKSQLKRNQSDSAVCKNEKEGRQRLRRLSEGNECDHGTQKNCVSRHASLECLSNAKKPTVGFDPHVWIYEYKPQFTIDELWFSDDELADFKNEAIQRVRHQNNSFNSATVLSTGTGRIIEVPSGSCSNANNGQSVSVSGPVMFNHPALSCDDEVDNDEAVERMIQDALSREIRNVLLVDPHEIFLALFAKSLKCMLGSHISITTARSGEEAIARIEGCRKAFPLRDGGSLHGFDIILVEERLGSLPMQRLANSAEPSTQAAGDDSIQRRRMTSGSALIRLIAQEEETFKATYGEGRFALLIGVSARFMQDQDILKNSGADILWAKPPPKMDKNQRNQLLRVLMKKRGRDNLDIFE